MSDRTTISWTSGTIVVLPCMVVVLKLFLIQRDDKGRLGVQETMQVKEEKGEHKIL